MTEQKQSLADFVFENKDKMPDNVYKILMEQYAKAEQQPKGFVEVVYLLPQIVKWGDNGHKLFYERKVAITKKYDDRFDEQCKEMKVGMMLYPRIVRNPYHHSVGSMEHDICLIENDADGEGLQIKYDGEDTHLYTAQVFVVSVRDL